VRTLVIYFNIHIYHINKHSQFCRTAAKLILELKDCETPEDASSSSSMSISQAREQLLQTGKALRALNRDLADGLIGSLGKMVGADQSVCLYHREEESVSVLREEEPVRLYLRDEDINVQKVTS
jgi:hypothetical protein